MLGKVSLYCTDTEMVRKQYQVFGHKQRNMHFTDEILFNFVSRFVKYKVFRYKGTCNSLMIYYFIVMILCQDSLNIRSSDTNKEHTLHW